MNILKWDKNKWISVAQALFPYVVILIAIHLMISYQTSVWSTHITGDRYLHFYRFYDDSMQLRTGNFSYFQTNYGFNQSGRIFNALYGPLFAYLNGLLLILCRTWYNFDILTIYLVFLIGGIGMYQLGRKARVNNIISILLAIIYLQFGIIVGFLEYNFMAWGAALAPFVMIQAINMVQDVKRPIHWLNLALILALCAQIHMLTTAILPFTLLPFAIYGLCVTPNKKEMIIDFFKAVGSFLLLTANIWGAFLVVYSKNKISAPNTFPMSQSAIKYSSAFFDHGKLSALLILLIVLQVIYVLTHFKKSMFNTLATIVSVIIILFSSVLVPWDRVQARFPKLGQMFQFPYRLDVGAIPLILVGIGISLTELMQTNIKVVRAYSVMIVFLTLMQLFAGTVRSEYATNTTNRMLNYYIMTKDVSQIKHATRYTNNDKLFNLIKRSEPDYLPIKTSADNMLYNHKILDQQNNYKRKIIGSRMILTWNSTKAEKRTLPVVMYKQSRLIVNGKDVSNTAKNQICMPIVNSRKGVNKASLQFIVPIWFWGLLLVTIVSWIGYLIYYVWLRLKEYEKNRSALA